MQKKNYNLELIRAFSFLMVIIIHVSNYFCRAFESIDMGQYMFSLVINTMVRVSVPCFFMISGALLLGRTETMKKSLERVHRFLSVLLVWTVIYYIFNIFYMHQTVKISKLLETPAEAHLWYLYVIIVIYLVLPFFQILCKGMDEKMEKAFILLGTIVVVVRWILAYYKMDLYYEIPVFGDRVYIYFFFIGYFLVKYQERIPKKKGLWTGIFAGSCLITVIITVINSMGMGDHAERFLNYGFPFMILASVAFFIRMLQVGDGKFQPKESLRKVIDVCCGCSFGIYLIHILFLDNFKKHVKAYEVSAYWAIPVLVIVIFAVSVLSVYVIRKKKIGRKIT